MHPFCPPPRTAEGSACCRIHANVFAVVVVLVGLGSIGSQAPLDCGPECGTAADDRAPHLRKGSAGTWRFHHPPAQALSRARQAEADCTHGE